MDCVDAGSVVAETIKLAISLGWDTDVIRWLKKDGAGYPDAPESGAAGVLLKEVEGR